MRRALPTLVLALATAACEEAAGPPAEHRVIDGDPTTGRILARAHGCGACHTVEGLPGAVGIVGPTLHDFAGRAFIAGRLPNQPDELVAFLVNPPAIDPGTAMPDMGLSPADARHIAAWLYRLPEGG
jgi:cytochrome c